MFPTMGDSMLPIPENSEVITQYVEDWTAIKPDTLFIVILKGDQDFVFKQVTLLENEHILLRSLNRLYEPYTVASEDVLEIWKYYKYQSSELPDAPTDFQQIKRLILDVKDEIHKKKPN